MMQLKLGAKGELVIPKKIREHLGLVKNKIVVLNVKDKTIEITSPKHDVLQACEERARKYNLNKKDIIYGDKLYEEVF